MWVTSSSLVWCWSAQVQHSLIWCDDFYSQCEHRLETGHQGPKKRANSVSFSMCKANFAWGAYLQRSGKTGFPGKG